MAIGLLTPKFTITGDAKVDNRLRQLSDKVSGRIMRGALSSGARVIVAAARALAPVGDTTRKTKTGLHTPGQLKRNITFVVRSYKGGLIRVAYIGGAWPAAAHAHLVEFGHRIVVGGTLKRRMGKKQGRATGGKTTARPFLRPAFEHTKRQAVQIVRAEIVAGLRAVR